MTNIFEFMLGLLFFLVLVIVFAFCVLMIGKVGYWVIMWAWSL